MYQSNRCGHPPLNTIDKTMKNRVELRPFGFDQNRNDKKVKEATEISTLNSLQFDWRVCVCVWGRVLEFE